MTRASMGRLAKVDLRRAWASEASGFTPWLATEENLRMLGDTIGLELELESQEKPVGPFRADILCKDTATDNWVLIENQLERTDHNHLGQLLTYAAGLDAVTIVWIAERFTEEHRAALDWLNEATGEEINFFGLEIELWQIGDSAIAPKFNVVSHSNEWTRKIRKSIRDGVELSDHKQLQQQFWAGFREYMDEQNGEVRATKPLPQHWMNHAIGRAGVKLASCVAKPKSGDRSPEIRAEVCLTDHNAKQYFSDLMARRDEIEQALGFPLTWHDPEGKNMCRIFTQKDTDFTDEALWPEQYEWLRERQEALRRVFAPIVKQLGQGSE